jgi:predicted phage terminase large subunit-like protein
MKEKLTAKQAAIKWADIIRAVRNATPIDSNEPLADKITRKKKLEANPEQWFEYYFPRAYSSRPMPFHTKASQRIINNPEWYEVRMWSRELAKSTRAMMEVLYLILVGHPTPAGRRKKRCVILTSCTQDNAIRLLRPYKAHLEANQRIINDYGIQEKISPWTDSELLTQDGAYIIAIGLDGQVRGIKNDEIRPDILLMDDVDTDKHCRNIEMVNQYWQKIDEAVLGTRSISDPTTVLWLGNRIAVDCCIWRAREMADHHDLINIRGQDGTSSWPTKNTEEHIARVLSKRSYAAQQKEYYNNPIVEGSVFKQMAWKPAMPIHAYTNLVCYTDPSFKDAKTNDYKATVLVGKYRDEYHVIKAFVEQTTTAEMIQWHYNIMDIVGQRACYYKMEQVFLQELIIQEFYKTSSTTGRTIPITGDQRAKDNKYMRIESLLQPLHANGKLYLNEAEQLNPHMKRLEQQFIAFAPGSRAHDDAPDAVEGAVWIINQLAASFKSTDIFFAGKKKSNKHF